MISSEQIQRWCELADAATPGPWRWRFGGVEQTSDGGKGYPIDFYPDCVTVQESKCYECGSRIGPLERDGQFIAEAREAVPRLAAECAALKLALLEACDIAESEPRYTHRARIAALRELGGT